VTHIPQKPDSHLRRLEVPGDLSSVADLIDLCFQGNMDEDGLDYLKHIRKAASDSKLVKWILAAGELVSFPLHGFVWLENNTIVGNLSLIPFFWQHRWRFLIANVAVHPEYRQRGIGRALTKKAVEHAQSLGHRDIWLHVRAGNIPAIRLYESLGFIERTLRATWQNATPTKQQPIFPDIHITKRRKGDWEFQKKYLNACYPEEVAWNLNYKEENFKPGIFPSMLNFLNDRDMKQWVARSSHQVLGTAIWEPTHQFADTIWLGISNHDQEPIVESLLKTIANELDGGRPLSINFPAYSAEIAFRNAGYRLIHNLIWMQRLFSGKEYV